MPEPRCGPKARGTLYIVAALVVLLGVVQIVGWMTQFTLVAMGAPRWVAFVFAMAACFGVGWLGGMWMHIGWQLTEGWRRVR